MYKLECIITDIIASFMNLESEWTNSVLNISKDTNCRAIHNHNAPTQYLNLVLKRESLLMFLDHYWVYATPALF